MKHAVSDRSSRILPYLTTDGARLFREPRENQTGLPKDVLENTDSLHTM